MSSARIVGRGGETVKEDGISGARQLLEVGDLQDATARQILDVRSRFLERQQPPVALLLAKQLVRDFGSGARLGAVRLDLPLAVARAGPAVWHGQPPGRSG